MPCSPQIACNTDVLDLKRSEDARNSPMVEIKEAMEGCDTPKPDSLRGRPDARSNSEGSQDRARPGLVLCAFRDQLTECSPSAIKLSNPGIQLLKLLLRQFPCGRAVVPGIQCQKLADLLKRETGRLRLFDETQSAHVFASIAAHAF